MFTIPKALYDRNFTVTEFPALGPGGGLVETVQLGGNGCVAIPFTAPAKKGATVHVHAGILPDARWDGTHPFGLATLVSISETPGDFSHNARAGVEASLTGMVGGYPRAGLYVALEAGKQYYVNAAHADPADGAIDLRVSLSFS